jgi:hypothetical protein
MQATLLTSRQQSPEIAEIAKLTSVNALANSPKKVEVPALLGDQRFVESLMEARVVIDKGNMENEQYCDTDRTKLDSVQDAKQEAKIMALDGQDVLKQTNFFIVKGEQKDVGGDFQEWGDILAKSGLIVKYFTHVCEADRSIGSLSCFRTGVCSPCGFLCKKEGCQNGADCRRCHRREHKVNNPSQKSRRKGARRIRQAFYDVNGLDEISCIHAA